MVLVLFMAQCHTVMAYWGRAMWLVVVCFVRSQNVCCMKCEYDPHNLQSAVFIAVIGFL